jgi:hypothetical protein
MIKTYISGPMTGLPDFNREAFAQTAQRLRRLALDVTNPAEVQLHQGATWKDYMRHDLAEMRKCKIVVMLRGWEASRGARIERWLAKRWGLVVLYE